MAVSFIGGRTRRTRRKPPTCHKLLTTSVAIGTDYIGRSKSNYHTTTATTARWLGECRVILKKVSLWTTIDNVFGEYDVPCTVKAPYVINNIIIQCTSYINYHKYINLIGQWVKIRTRDDTGQKSYSVK